MYLEFFSLKRHPFRITPDPSLFYPGGVRGRGVVLDALVYGITTGEGILKVVGEVGSGKTMLCRMLEESLPDNVEIVYLANPNLSARDIVYAIAFELRLDVDSATDRLMVMQKLQDYLLNRHAEGGTVVVFIEEAQSMPLDTLEEVRLLSNLETHRHKLMQIVMFGQPELDDKLEQKSIRQLKERITHSFKLEPLTEDEIREYLHFRLQTAGCPWPHLFSPQAEKVLASASDGLTRRVNILADKSLLAAYADPNTRQIRNSAGEIQPMVQVKHVKTAIADSNYTSARSLFNWRRLSGYAATLVLGVLLGTVYFLWLGKGGEPVSIVTAVPVNAGQAANVQGAVQREQVVRVAAVSVPAASPVILQRPAQSGSAQGSSAVPPQESSQLQPAGNTDIQLVEEIAQQASTPVSTPVSTAPETRLNQVAATTPVSEITSAAGSQLQDVQNSGLISAPPPAISAAPVAPAMVDQSGAADSQRSLSTTDISGNEQRPALAGMEKESAPPQRALVTPEPDKVAPAPERRLPQVAGLAAARLTPSREWLGELGKKTGYSIQMFAARTNEREKLQEYLEFLSLVGFIDQAYICLISGNRSRPEQWLVLYSEFDGISDVRKFIDDLPPYLSQNSPYARNLNDIRCAN